MRSHYLRSYRELRAQWRKTVKENNEAISKLLDKVGEEIVSTIFTAADDALAAPANLAPKPKAN